MGITSAGQTSTPFGIDARTCQYGETEEELLKLTAKHPERCIVVSSESEVSVFFAGQVYQKYSRLLGRLGLLLAEMSPLEDFERPLKSARPSSINPMVLL
jgi:hypothetical protein